MLNPDIAAVVLLVTSILDSLDVRFAAPLGISDLVEQAIQGSMEK